MSHRHRSRKALIYFLLCLPLAFIAYLCVAYYTDGINVGEVKAIEVTVPGLNPAEYTDKENIDFFVGLVNNATELSAPLRTPDESGCVTLKCIGETDTKIYKIYPELSQTGCMIMSPGGKYYLIQADDAVNLLSRSEMEYLYTGSFIPNMFVVTGHLEKEVVPSSYEWYYKKQNGESAKYTGKETTEQTQLYSIYSDRVNSISFTRQPDDITITIADTEGNLIGETDFNSLIFGRDTRLTVTVEASWKQKSDSKYYGSASYAFDVIYDIPAEVTFSATEGVIGGFVYINVKYLNEGESLAISSPLKTGLLQFTENNGVKTAVLAIADDNLPGDYDINYTAGDNSGTVKLTVTGTPREERSDIYRLGISAADYEEKFGKDATDELEAIMQAIFESSGSQTYSLLSAFALPSQSATLSVGYGTRIIVNIDDTADTHLFYAIGNSYDVIENSKITAAADGKVVYAGNTKMLGNLIVIDHGCGVASWYYGLANIERSVGTLVQKGSVLGFAGENSYTGTPSLGFCVSAGKAFINPPVE
jgi:hypothetical protein